MKKTILTLSTILFLLFTPLLVGCKTSVKANQNLIHVPTDYPTIQEAINNANVGDTIFVHSGTYQENVFVNKSVALIGEDPETTLIDGGEKGSVIFVIANNVIINGFTVQKSGTDLYDSAILVDHSSGNNISLNKITSNHHGIYLSYSRNNTVSGNNVYSNGINGISLDSSTNNTVFDNNVYSNGINGIRISSSSGNTVSGNNIYSNSANGIRLDSSSSNTVSGNNIYSNSANGIQLDSSSSNFVSGNNIYSNNHGTRLDSLSNNNTIYHNNFFNNKYQVLSDSMNLWNHNAEGNYWSDYNGTDIYHGPYQNVTGSDGIGDTPYLIETKNQDNYPLMGKFSDFRVAWKDKTYHATTICNSIISNFRFEVERETGNKIMSFNVTGKNGTVGFCRVMIPIELMNYSYIVLIDEEEVIPTLLNVSDKAHAYLYFTYVHSSHTVTIISSKLLYLYNELLDKYAKLQIDFDNLNSTYYELLNNYGALLGSYSQLLERYSALNLTTNELLGKYGTLLGNYSQLLERYSALNLTTNELLGKYGTLLGSYSQLLERDNALNASYQEWLLNYSELQANYTSLLLEHTQNIRSLTYAFIATTIIFTIAVVYLSTHAHRKVSTSHSTSSKNSTNQKDEKQQH